MVTTAADKLRCTQMVLGDTNADVLEVSVRFGLPDRVAFCIITSSSSTMASFIPFVSIVLLLLIVLSVAVSSSCRLHVVLFMVNDCSELQAGIAPGTAEEEDDVVDIDGRIRSSITVVLKQVRFTFL